MPLIILIVLYLLMEFENILNFEICVINKNTPLNEK